jgi:hypothetical protein
MNNRDPDQVKIMSQVFTEEPQVCLNITLEEHEQGMKEAARRAKMEDINNLGSESREKLKRQELQVYTRQKKAPQAPLTDPKLSQQKLPPPPVSRLLPNPTLAKAYNTKLNFDLESALAKMSVTVPLKEIIKVPSMKNRFERFFKVQDEPIDPPIMLHADHFNVQYDDHLLFFMSLQINDKCLNNCMLDSGAGANMMSLRVMEQLGLKTTQPYRNVCGFESRAIPTHGVVENVKAHLARYPERVIPIDIMVVDVPDVWRMLLSRKCVTMLGGTLEMDLTNINMPLKGGTFAHLPNMPMAKIHLEEIDIDTRTHQVHESIKESLPMFSPCDLALSEEEDL